MLAIRMQRRGRKNQAQYRLVVQDSRHHPTSGRIVAYVGTYNPHTKEANIETEKVKTYLTNGAQPSPRIARLLKSQGVKLPTWVSIDKKPKKTIRNPEKLRKNQPKTESTSKPEEPVKEVTENESEVPAEDQAIETELTTESAEVAKEVETEPKPAEETADLPNDEPKKSAKDSLDK